MNGGATRRSDGRWRESTRLIWLKRDGARSSRKTADPGIRRALEPLLEHRRAQAGSRYKLFWGADGYRPPEQSWDFLRRRGHAEGAVDPERVPYYLLIVGEPEEIPYRFQYLLDAQFAVGRITLERTGRIRAVRSQRGASRNKWLLQTAAGGVLRRS